jgi:putative transposase
VWDNDVLDELEQAHITFKGADGEIAAAMQLVAARTGQEFNLRKRRCGAYWQDRYHATAVDSAVYFGRCMTYIDLNMVRAGAVTHPAGWPHSGYVEIQRPRKRYRIIDYDALTETVDASSLAAVQQWQAEAVADALERRRLAREEWWSQSVAVGRASFVERVQAELGVRAAHRAVDPVDDTGLVALREPRSTYGAFWMPKVWV